MINKNKSIKQGYKQTSIGIIPQDWEVVRLGEVYLVQSGGTPLQNEKVLNCIFLFCVSLMLYKEFEKLSSNKIKITNLFFYAIPNCKQYKKNHKIKLPTLAEQKKIAQVLSVCDKEIETLNLKFECLKAQKKGTYAAAPKRKCEGKILVKFSNEKFGKIILPIKRVAR